MIEIINRKKLSKHQIKLVEKAINKAVKFIIKKYGSFYFHCKIKVSNNKDYSLYYKNKYLIKLCGRERVWGTYKKKKVGLYSKGIYINLKLNYTLNLIHEFTHLIQNLQKRKYSEVETTINEIDYVKQFHPKIFKKLKKVKK